MAEKDIGGKFVRRKNSYTSESNYQMGKTLIGWLIYVTLRLFALGLLVIGFPLILDLIIGIILVEIYEPKNRIKEDSYKEAWLNWIRTGEEIPGHEPESASYVDLEKMIEVSRQFARDEGYTHLDQELTQMLEEAQYIEEHWLEIDVNTETPEGGVIVSHMPELQFGFDNMNNIYVQEDEDTWVPVGRDY